MANASNSDYTGVYMCVYVVERGVQRRKCGSARFIVSTYSTRRHIQIDYISVGGGRERGQMKGGDFDQFPSILNPRYSFMH